MDKSPDLERMMDHAHAAITDTVSAGVEHLTGMLLGWIPGTESPIGMPMIFSDPEHKALFTNLASAVFLLEGVESYVMVAEVWLHGVKTTDGSVAPKAEGVMVQASDRTRSVMRIYDIARDDKGIITALTLKETVNGAAMHGQMANLLVARTPENVEKAKGMIDFAQRAGLLQRAATAGHVTPPSAVVHSEAAGRRR